MARVFGQGLGEMVGSVLPLRRVADGDDRHWQSGKWFFRDGPMFLVPGDSPVGFRLPLESLPWADPAHIPYQTERDPFSVRPPLPPHPSRDRQDRLRVTDSAAYSLGIYDQISGHAGPGRVVPQDRNWDREKPKPGREEPGLVRTAMAVEARGGHIHVFFPPLYEAEDWIDLAAAIEATAEEMGRKVFLEGYAPPSDERLLSFSVTPDPGVIEVNVHPATSWAQQVERTEALYEVAREEGLATEKFMLDGRHIGTGGGNHVVMGGIEVPDSPFLRRPDLLKSLLGFWQNHPSLSYLFSGLFIGPSSQHPRIDEARQDSLNELDIAFSQISPFKETPPWLTDRLFRNILADMTGNTHRTEFSIDKMYAGEALGGRRGLVEFRAFEMPPHAQMSLAQTLLMRSAVAAFWQKPYERRLVRWAGRLHDEFMLRHYVEQDLKDALETIGEFGFPVPPEWFAPHLEFRFPVIGSVATHGAQLELSHAHRSLGMCWARIRRRAARSATSTVRPSACRRRSRVGWRSASSSPATVSPCRCSRPTRSANMSAASASRPGTRPARCTRRSRRSRRWSSTSTTAGAAGPWAGSHTTSRIPAASATTGSRSMRTKRRPGGARASRSTATARGRCRSRADRRVRSIRAASICGALHDRTIMPVNVMTRTQ